MKFEWINRSRYYRPYKREIDQSIPRTDRIRNLKTGNRERKSPKFLRNSLEENACIGPGGGTSVFGK